MSMLEHDFLCKWSSVEQTVPLSLALTPAQARAAIAAVFGLDPSTVRLAGLKGDTKHQGCVLADLPLKTPHRLLVLGSKQSAGQGQGRAQEQAEERRLANITRELVEEEGGYEAILAQQQEAIRGAYEGRLYRALSRPFPAFGGVRQTPARLQARAEVLCYDGETDLLATLIGFSPELAVTLLHSRCGEMAAAGDQPETVTYA
jgi:hypothetical protein